MGGRRSFRLLSNRILISGRTTSGSRSEVMVPLEVLRPDPDRHWVRPAAFWLGLFLLLTCVPIAFACSSVLSFGWVAFYTAFALFGALIVICTAKRIEWATFRNTMGQATVSVARAGRHSDQFPYFVSAVSSAISHTRSREA